MARTRPAPPSFRYVPAASLDGRPHVIVDGAPRGATACTLSHWPGTPTPVALWHDVSAGIVLRARAAPGALPSGVEVASIDHYDADGVIALGLLCVEGLAEEHGPLMVEAARAGDFDVVTGRAAAQVAFAVGALGDVEHGEPIDATAWAATEALRILPALAADPGSFGELWRDEADAFDASRRALAEGWATIEERGHVDLAVVRVDAGHPDAPRAAWKGAPLHPAAVHSATDLLRVATVADGLVEVRYRYESWVRLETRRPVARVDLAGVAAELTAMESAGMRWVFDGAGALTGALHTTDGGAGSLDPEDVVELVSLRLEALDAGPPAWDPYAMPAGRG